MKIFSLTLLAITLLSTSSLMAQDDDDFLTLLNVINELNTGPGNSTALVGTWKPVEDENDFLALIFYEDGTYIHAEVDFDDQDEISGMEWGTYTYNSSTGEVTANQSFDNNGDTGLTDFSDEGSGDLFISIDGDILTATFDDDGDGNIDGSISFQRQTSDGFLGTFIPVEDENDYLSVTFFDDDTYLHAEIDFDDQDEISGMEWGTFTYNENTGEVIANQSFDNNGDTGLTDFSDEGPGDLFISIDGDILTATFDDDGDGNTDGTLDFQRAATGN